MLRWMEKRGEWRSEDTFVRVSWMIFWAIVKVGTLE
jgi:hypothetical protein